MSWLTAPVVHRQLGVRGGRAGDPRTTRDEAAVPGRRLDRGAAVVEFSVLALVLMVPLVYVVVAALTVQRAAFAVTQAAREAGRAAVTFAVADPEPPATVAARLAMRDQGLDLPAGALRVGCDRRACDEPGAVVTVTVGYTVHLPLLPHSLFGHPVAAVDVVARHAEPMDPYREHR